MKTDIDCPKCKGSGSGRMLECSRCDGIGKIKEQRSNNIGAEILLKALDDIVWSRHPNTKASKAVETIEIIAMKAIKQFKAAQVNQHPAGQDIDR